MKKRILSIVLAVLMLVSLLPVTALAADPTPDASQVTVTQNGVTVVKKAVWTNQANGEAKITFELTGGTSTSTEIKDTAIVLVIDCSGSMAKDINGDTPDGWGGSGLPSRVKLAKDAAQSFVEKFLGASAPQNYKDNVQIAIVPYADDVQTGCDLTNQKST